MKLIQICILVIISAFLSFGVAEGSGDLTVSGTTTTTALTVSSLDCTANTNGGTLTADASGVVSCSDDDSGGSGNTLDAAYDEGGAGAGRIITADSGAVFIQGSGGLDLDVGSLLQTPGNPVQTGSLNLSGWSGAASVYVSGRYAYVVDLDLQELQVIDVADPSAPNLVGSLAIGGSAVAVYVSGRYAYVVNFSLGDLQVIDVSDPSAPSLAGSLGIGGNPRSVYVSGRYAYVVDSSSDDLKVIDVSDPSAPSLTGSLAILDLPTTVFVSGRYAYVVDYGSDDLKVIDVSDPSTPSLAGSLATGPYPRSVYVSGRYAYVVDGSSDDLRVIDVSDPSTPSQVGIKALGEGPRSVYVSGRYAYVVTSDSGYLQVIDVSDPSTPSVAGGLDIGDIPISVYVSGRYAYVLDDWDTNLRVVDVSGAEVTSLITHSLEAGNLQVRNDIIAQGQLQVSGGINVGTGGIFSDGDVGVSGDAMIIGDATIDGDLTITGSCSGCASDINLKQNIQPLVNALDKISHLRGVSYDWQEDVREAQYYPGSQIGVLGQDVETIFPELVGTDSRGYKFVRYQKLVAPLIEAVKELKGENDMLRAELRVEKAAVDSRLEALERRLN